MEKRGSINKQGIKYHKRKIMLRRLKNRIRKNFKEVLEILKIVGGALIFLAEIWLLMVEVIILFG